MEFSVYNPVDEKGGCIARSISKAFNKDYNIVKNELIEIAKKHNLEDYREEIVFDEYLLSKKATLLNTKDILIKDLNLIGTYIIFCNKDDFYHMVTIIDNVIYDKSDVSQDLKVIKMYQIKH